MTPPSTDPTPALPPARSRWRGWTAGIAVGCALAGLVSSLPFTERGTRWLLQGAQALLPGLSVESPTGPLLGDFNAGRLTWALGNGQRLVLEQAGWTRPRFEHDRFWGLHLARLSARRVALEGVSNRPPGPGGTALPADLVLPMGLVIDQVQVARLDLPALGSRPLRDLAFSLALPAGDHARHEVRQLSLRWERLQAEGSASIGADAPMLLKAQLRLRNDAAERAPEGAAAAVLNENWQAQLQALGGLARFKVQGRLRARSQSVDAEALVRPGQAMPLESADVRMEGFDLAGVSHGFPRTALAGLLQAHLGTQGQTAPLQVEGELRNTAAGPWATGALPLRSLQFKGLTDLAELGQGELQQLVLELGSAERSGGRLQAQGQWRTEGTGADRTVGLRLQTRLQALRPAEIDPRAPAIELSGPARVDWQQPWPAGPDTGTGTGSLGTGRLQAEWTGRTLTSPKARGSTDTGVPPVKLQIDAEGTPTLLTLRHFEATSGPSSWIASGTARRLASAWDLQADSRLAGFDPALWLGQWSGLSPSRLDGRLTARLQWLDGTAAWQTRLRGDARLQLQPSLLAGVPGQGEVTLRSADGLLADLHLALGAGDPSDPAVDLSAQGRLDPRTGREARDHWTVRLRGRQLAALSPWLRPLPGRPAIEGQANAELALEGRWPFMTAQGQWQAPLLRWQQQETAASEAVASAPGVARPRPQPIELHDLQAQWRLGSQPTDPFEITLRAAQARSPVAHLLATTLSGTGTMGQHSLRWQSTLVPQQNRVQIATQPDGTATATSSVEGGAPWALQAAAEGGWVLGNASADRTLRRSAASAPWGWQGRLSMLQARRTPPPGLPANGQAPLSLRLDPTTLTLLQDDLGLRAALEPTRLVLNEAALSIEALHYTSGPAGPTLDARAQLPPTPAVPLLMLAQPGFGWRGDLQVAGRIDLQGRPDAMNAVLDLHRERGDLAVADLDLGTAAQTVGLTELSLQLRANGGRWSLQERVAGQRMGRLSGDLSTTTAPDAWIPPADAPLRGQLDLDIAQLGYWGAWLPTGWRLAGQLGAQARVSGRVGAPRFDGEVQGQHIAVRNVLQGIDWREASVQARLASDSLLLERLVLQAGAGTLTAQGRATLGPSPTVTLQARAERFAALQRVDRRVVVSGNADLLVDATRLRLTGQLQADEGRVDFSQAEAPGLSSDVAVHRSNGDGEPALTAARGPQRQLQLDVRADLGRRFHLTGRGLNTRLAGELRLTAANNRPLLQGTIHAEDGTYASYGQKLGIDRGLVVFTGPIENPRLDVLATRTDISDIKVGVAITGTAQSPRVRLYSDPDMSDTDKLSWLLMGRASDGLGRSDLALLQRAAYALLAGESDGPSLVQRIGLDTLSVSQNDTGTVQQTVVSVGKQISSRWYLGYERSLQATTGTWLLTYKIAQRFTVRAQSGYQNALDLIWSWRWGLNE